MPTDAPLLTMRPKGWRLRGAWWLAIAALAGLSAPAPAVDLTARAALLGSVAAPGDGDLASTAPWLRNPTADQQSLRLMLDDQTADGEWSLHARLARQHQRGAAIHQRHSSDLFRYRSLADDRTTGDPTRNATRWSWELDRAYFKFRLDKASVQLGRQSIDWGSGRLWQPLNVFGAFAPTDLDTDYKPGIDAAVVNWYPSDFSSLTVVQAFAPRNDPTVRNSAAMYYRRQVGQTAQMALVAGEITGHRAVGASIEDDWRGIGWRLGALHTRGRSRAGAVFWIAGLDYQFDNGTLVTAEWYDNGRGALRQADLPARLAEPLVTTGLQQHGVRRVFGATVRRDVSPLLNASYTLLVSRLKNAANGTDASLLHQIGLTWSIGNESDLLAAWSWSTGSGLDAAGRPHSEFGHLPARLTVRWRRYF